MLPTVSFLRTRVFAILFALLTLGGYGYEICAHAMPEPESSVEHQHSLPSDQGACHHCTCHCSPTVMANVERLLTIQPRMLAGYAVDRGQFAPDAVPIGIDHPPQLA